MNNKVKKVEESIKDSLKKNEELLSVEELENVEGGCGFMCSPGCLVTSINGTITRPPN